MMMWMQDRVQNWDAGHEDDMLWGAGITNRITEVINREAAGPEVKQKDTDETAGKECMGLEPS
jgi:hypothetical protein